MAVGMIDPRRANTPFYIGVSTDTKPKPSNPNAGPRFYEWDTGIWFIYTGGEEGKWVEFHEPDDGSIPADSTSTEVAYLQDIHLELVRIRRLLEISNELDSDDLDLAP